MLNETHDPAQRSWVASANVENTDFPIQNLPFGVLSGGGGDTSDGRIGVAIGESILDLRAVSAAGLLAHLEPEIVRACESSTLNALMQQGRRSWSPLRLALSRLLREGSPSQDRLRSCMVPQKDAALGLPASIGDFTDFFASVHHASRAGATVRPDQPLLPNYDWIPIAYHGRSSSVRAGPVTIVRPRGQIMHSGAALPVFQPTGKLDYEAELGFFVGPGNALGEPIGMGQADEQIFGLCLLNDWSARDIQSWESKPLGPFLAKNFATVISPWVVTWEALEPYRVPWQRGERTLLGYLQSEDNERDGGIDIQISVELQSALMRAQGMQALRISTTSSRHGHWSLAQMVAHHTSNGCDLRPGDLIGTGTQSGPAVQEAGCLLELTASEPLHLPTGERRKFVEDGDAIRLAGRCSRPGYRSIGFGQCVTLISA